MQFMFIFLSSRRAFLRSQAQALLACACLTILLSGVPHALYGQAMQVPRTGPEPGSRAEQMTVFDPQHLADRPYSGALPAPIFPSTKRVQRLFTVAYAYDYAFSTYTPAAVLPIVARSAVKRDTPEGAVLALTSALRTNDLEGIVASSDAAEQKILRAQIADPGFGPAKLKDSLSKMFPGKTVELLARIEVAGYVILDVRSVGSSMPYIPLTFKLNVDRWEFTNELAFSGSQFLANFTEPLAGVVNTVQPQPVAALDAPNLQQMVQAQGEFLRQHLNRNTVIEAGK